MGSEKLKSVVLVAQEAAAALMLRDVQDHGEDGSVRRALVDAWREAAANDFLARIGYHLSRGDITAVSVVNGAPYDRFMGGTPPTDSMWLLSAEQEVKALELLGQEAPDTRPVFTMPARPMEVPPLLRAIPADTPILTRVEFGGRSGSATATAGDYVKELDDIIRRQARGIFTVSEAAQVLADSRPGADVKAMRSKMQKAHQEGKLSIREPGDMLPKDKDERCLDFLDVVTVSDVDAWLGSVGAGYKFPAAPVVGSQRQERQPGTVLLLAADTTHLVFDQLAHLIADALWPDQGEGDERWLYAGARVNLDEELAEAVKREALRVLDPLTLGPNRFPIGAALQRAKVAVEDLRQWLQTTRRMDVQVGPATEDAPPASAGAQEVAQDSQALSEGPHGHTLSTDEVSEAFKDIGMGSADWQRLLTKDRPDWLKACIAVRGRQGAKPVQGRWWPLKIAEALVSGKSRKSGCVPVADLDRAFRRPLLRQSLEAWNDMRADNPAWGD